jgi:RNA polymerase sigma-70 factor (ECF subfamily)
MAAHRVWWAVATSRLLVEQAQQGDREAFALLVDGSTRRLVGIAGLILHDPARAEDAAQDALIRAWRSLPTLRDPDRFDAWLTRMLVRACQDQLRKARHEIRSERLLPEHGARVKDSAAELADRDEIDRGLQRLSAEQRIPIVLRYYGGLSDREVAEATGLPIGTVKSRITRGLQAMRAALAADARGTRVEERMA